MRKSVLALVLLLVLGCGAPASAGPLSLFSWATNVNGVVNDSFVDATMPALFDTSGFNYADGLGVVSATIAVPDSYSLLLWLDHDVTGPNNPLDDDFGATSGAVPTGLSWEIDEPGYRFGNIYANAAAGALDGTIFDGAFNGPEDVSMALGWDFVVDTGYITVVTFSVSTVAPTGFYLAQFDPPTQTTLYYSTSLATRPAGDEPPVPEPGTLLLFGTALAGVARFARRRR